MVSVFFWIFLIFVPDAHFYRKQTKYTTPAANPLHTNNALHTQEERPPSGAPKEELESGQMIFEKKSSLEDQLKISQRRRQLLVEVRRGARTCDTPCILERDLDSAFMQTIVWLTCSDSLIYTGRHTFQRHALPLRGAADGVNFSTVPQGRFFFKNHPAKFFLRGP